MSSKYTVEVGSSSTVGDVVTKAVTDIFAAMLIAELESWLPKNAVSSLSVSSAPGGGTRVSFKIGDGTFSGTVGEFRGGSFTFGFRAIPKKGDGGVEDTYTIGSNDKFASSAMNISNEMKGMFMSKGKGK